MNAAGEERMLSLNELEIRREAYENTKLSKERAKVFRDKHINRKKLYQGQKVFYMTRGVTFFLKNFDLGGPVLLYL